VLSLLAALHMLLCRRAAAALPPRFLCFTSALPLRCLGTVVAVITGSEYLQCGGRVLFNTHTSTTTLYMASATSFPHHAYMIDLSNHHTHGCTLVSSTLALV
jgi:hypothetical protein